MCVSRPIGDVAAAEMQERLTFFLEIDAYLDGLGYLFGCVATVRRVRQP